MTKRRHVSDDCVSGLACFVVLICGSLIAGFAIVVFLEMVL